MATPKTPMFIIVRLVVFVRDLSKHLSEALTHFFKHLTPCFRCKRVTSCPRRLTISSKSSKARGQAVAAMAAL